MSQPSPIPTSAELQQVLDSLVTLPDSAFFRYGTPVKTIYKCMQFTFNHPEVLKTIKDHEQQRRLS